MSNSVAPHVRASETPRALALDPSVILVPVGVFVIVVATAAPNGSYFPSSWGWISLACLWAAAVGLLVIRDVRFATLQLAYLAAWCALLAWTAASLIWSPTSTRTMYEVERVLVYVSFAFAFAVLARRSLRYLLPALLAGIVAVASYALATRLLPDRVGTFNSFAGYRLAEPLGYWNAVSIFVGIGIVLAVGLAARAHAIAVRALSAASLVLLVPVLYFTFGRGGWGAIVLGLAAAVVVDPRRLQLVTTLIVVAPWPAIAVWRAYESPSLTTQFSQLASASHEGGRLALTIAGLAIVAALVTAGFTLVTRRVTVGPRLRYAYGVTLAALLVGCVAGGITAYGGPSESARRAIDSIKQASPTVSGNETQRLFSLSSNGRLDTWEAAIDDFQAHPVLGRGAGTFERWWLANRSVPLKVRDAHSLYLETLAELGPVGLAALLAVICAPLVAAVRARRSPYVAPALAGFVALVVHAGLDWDWEVPAVMIAGLTCAGVLLLADGDREGSRRRMLAVGPRTVILALIVALTAFSFVTLSGNRYLGQASGALDRGETALAARDARRAARWEPWSTDALARQADAALTDASLPRARQLYRQAIAKDGGDWELWLGLALASQGEARRRALDRAAALNPLGAEIKQLRGG